MDIDLNAPVITRKEIMIAAPLAVIWNLHTDISGWSRWNKDITNSSLNAPLAVGTTFHWMTAGMNIASTIDELIPQRMIGWSGLVKDIMGVHVWRFEPVESRVRVQTAESWNGESVRQQTDSLQAALDKSLESWLESLKKEAESR